MPVPYRTSRTARSRRCAGPSPVTAASSEPTSSSLSALGRPCGTGGGLKSDVGSDGEEPSTTRNLCSERTATIDRATEAGASPLARR